MRIIEINIKCFGKLKDFLLKPGENVNIIYGKNESGKSTVMAFIKAVFYGMESGEIRRKYEPWDGGQPGGSIEFEQNGIVYFLKRTFGESKIYDSISLFDKTNGESIPLSPGQEPGAYLFGINIRTFVSSVFIGQGVTAIDGDNHEIIERLVNLTSAGDEHVSKREVDKRLGSAAAVLDSKKANSVLPELRKQKRELIDSRDEIRKALEEADRLRDKIAIDEREKKTLCEQKAFLEEMADRLQKRGELEEIDAILRKRDEIADLEEKFSKLDRLFSGELADGMSDFIADSGKLLNEEKAKRAVLQQKEEELEELRKQSMSIDRQKLSMLKTVRKYNKEIAIAFDQYDALLREKKELELAREERDYITESSSEFKSVIGICAIVLLPGIVLGLISHWLFYIISVFAVVIILVYMISSKKDADPLESISEEESDWNDWEEQMDELNEEMRPILDDFGVSSMEEFDSLYKSIEQNQKKYLEAKESKDKLEDSINRLQGELEGIREQLRENLAMYHETRSSEEATKIINKLSDMQREHDKLSFQLTSARETYRFMLRNRDVNELQIYRDQLRNSVELEVPASFTKENIREKLAAAEQQLNEISDQISREQTELTLMPYNMQSVQSLSDEIKALNRKIEHYEFELDAINEAQTVLNEAFHEMQIDFGPMINYRATRVLTGMTGNSDGTVLVSDQLIPSFAEQGDSMPRSSDSLGAGTYNQIYLALRLALSGVVSDEMLPVMLDDSFVQFDDDRMTEALRFIKEDNALGEIGQVIIFTCHKRMISAAKKLEMTESVFSM